jgi:two-component system LytT family response regulator
MIRALIADDEPLARSVVRGLLASYGDVDVVGESRNGIETLGAIRSLAPDLVFLDVQMPDLNAFDVLASLTGEDHPAVVFVTAYDDFAVQAFEQAALDYLVKPFTDDRFHRAMARVRRHVAAGDVQVIAQAVSALLDRRQSAPKYLHRILATTGSRSVSIRVSEILWIEADDYYARLHVPGASHLVRQALASLEGQLDPEKFVRIHRGAIVNMDCVRELRRGDRGQLDVVVGDGSRIAVSERRREGVLRAFGALQS